MKKFFRFLAVSGLMMAAGSAIAAAPAYTLDPEAGSTVTDLSHVTISWVEHVAFDDNAGPMAAVLVNKTTGAEYNTLYGPTQMGRGATYSLDFFAVDTTDEWPQLEPITEPGEYEMTVSRMYLAGEYDTEVVEWLDPIVVSYKIEYPYAYALVPSAGTATDLSKVTLTFADQVVSIYEGNRMPVASLSNLTTGAEYVCVNPDRNTSTTAGSEYTFVFVGEDYNEGEDVVPVTEPGEYLLTIRGLYTGEGDDIVDLPVITATYEIAYPVEYSLTPDPALTPADLQTVSINFADKMVAFYENSRMPVAVLENLTTGSLYTCEGAIHDARSTNPGITYTLNFIGEDENELLPITEPGYYALTIRALGLQNENGEMESDLPVITANYYIPYPVMYNLNPDAGAYVEDLQKVVLSFPEDSGVEFYENNRMPVATLENLNSGAIYTCVEADRDAKAMDALVYNLVFIAEDETEVAPITEPGQYLLTVQALNYLNENEERVALPVIVANYTIAYPVEYVLNPDNGASVENLKTISIEFPNNKNVGFYEGNRMPVAVLVNNTTGSEYVCEAAVRDTHAMTEGIAYTLTFIPDGEEEAMDINEQGYYTLTIKALAYVDESGNPTEALPLIYANYNVNYPVEYVLEPSSEATVNDLMTVSLEFPNNKNIGFFDNNRMPVAVLVNNTTGSEYVCEAAVRDTRAMTEGIVYTLTFIREGEEEAAPVTEEGTYTLTIRALGYTNEAGEAETALPNIVATYYVVEGEPEPGPEPGPGPDDAVEGIAADADGVYTVYNLQGIRVLKTNNAEELNNLNGLYIVNGKKVIVRK